jgi:hypothetical protein
VLAPTGPIGVTVVSMVPAAGSALEEVTPPGARELLKSDRDLDPDQIGRKLAEMPSMRAFFEARTTADQDKALTVEALNGGVSHRRTNRLGPAGQGAPPTLTAAPSPGELAATAPVGTLPPSGAHAPLAASAPVNVAEDARIIELTPQAEAWASTNLPRFRRTCGDFFVAAIKQGAELSGFVSIATTSRQEQQQIKVAAEGDGFGFSASGKFSQAMDQAASNSSLTLKYAQSGGKGVTVATDKAQLISNVQNLARSAASDPYNYEIIIISYDSLDNWPQENSYHVPLGPFKDLAREYGKWATLRDDLDDIATHPDHYLLDRTGASLAELGKIRDKAAAKVSAIYQQAKLCTEEGPTSSGGKLSNGCALPVGMTAESDLPDRAKLPLPLATFGSPIELTYGAADLRNAVLDLWVRRVNSGRCRIDPNDTSYCHSAFSLTHESVPPIRDVPFALLNPISNRCLTATRVNEGWKATTETCSPTGDRIQLSPYQKFYYNPANKDLYLAHQVDGQTLCLDVAGFMIGPHSPVIFYACHNQKNQVFNVKPAEGTPRGEPAVVFEGQDSHRCLDAAGVGSGVQATVYDCGKGNTYQAWKLIAAK